MSLRTCSVLSIALFVAAASGCAGSGQPVPAAGDATEVRVTRIDRDDLDALQREARIVRTIDELSDRRMIQATVASIAANDPAVRAYAAELMDDFRSLRAREAKLGIELGFVPIKAERAEAFEHQVHTDVLSLMENRGADFDRAFVSRMIAEHEASLRLVETRLLRDAQAPALRVSLEHDVLRLLRRHLERTRALSASLEPRAG